MTKELEGKARDQLFEDLFCGQLTPQQAEARAQECGLQPLKPKLDPALYDPMEEPDWTLAMARAWIAWGELDLVREVSPRWRQDSHIWHLRKFREPNKKGGWTERTGWSLEQVHKQKPSLQLALLDARQAGETGLSKSSMRAMIPSAQAELWRRLRDDELSATVSADGMVSKIPAREWAYLELTDFHGEDFLAVRSGNSLSRKYLARDVLIARLDLMGLWRHEPRPTARGEARATKDLERAVELYREGKDPLPVYAQWSVTAPKEYSITGRGARRAWDKAAANYPELSSPKGKTKTRRGDKATSNHRT